MAEVDDSELEKLATGLRKIAPRVIREGKPVMAKGALNVKKGLQAGAKKSRHFYPIARSISYDTKAGHSTVETEVGVDRDRGNGQQHLAGIAYFGGARGGGGTLDFDQPMADEEPNIDKYLDQILQKALNDV
ncbi:hypothetical protein NQ036_06810 [Brevibacterium sp. 91QC2O2]|uniref:hypothetical protein n=1 Tax=Brevibacterium sp. 91QC2O2 TaxID=2968458 RepID=UPI00211D06E0|nr:hypothetical protein [Brevibacterium sp. 91QC2O2]MCQ9367954.1 hypothetical protein [Brevibacterium sp. 91QC2O2]